MSRQRTPFWFLTATLLAVGGLVASWTARPAHAIPTFARKYETSCARCHTAFPRLNAYGRAFKLRGYQTLGEFREGTVDVGDELLALLREFPLAARVILRAHAEEDAEVGVEFPSPYLSLFTGGTFARNIGFYSEIDPGEGVEKWNLVFADLSRNRPDPTALNLQLGHFELMDFVLSQHRTMTRANYAIYQTSVGQWNLAGQQRGFFLFGTVGSHIGEEEALEGLVEEEAAANEVAAEDAFFVPDEEVSLTSYEVPRGLFWQLGLVRGDEASVGHHGGDGGNAHTDRVRGGAWATQEDEEEHDGITFLPNSHWDVFGRLAWHPAPTLRLGTFGYWGRSTLQGMHEEEMHEADNSFRRLAFDVVLEGGDFVDIAGALNRRWVLTLLWAWGRDSNPLAEHEAERVEHNGGFAQLLYLFNDRTLTVLRYDRVRSDDLLDLETETFTANFTHYLRRNIKVSLEGTTGVSGHASDRAGLEIQIAF